MFIIDFDGILFDTYQFAQDRMKVLAGFGIDKELYQKTYHEARNGISGFVSYSDKRHAQILGIEGFDEEKIYKALSAITANAKKYVFDDAFIFLENLKKRDEELILLSLGDSMFQEEKIKNTSVHDFFERVFMVDDTKAHILKELFGTITEKKVWFINDKVKETRDLIKEFPQLVPVMMVSKFFDEKEYVESKLPYFKSLTEIGDYIADK